MRNKMMLFALVLNSFIPTSFLLAETNEKSENNEKTVEIKNQPSANPTPKINLQTTPRPRFNPFTGQVAKSKVRLRLQPAYDGQVVKEIEPGDLFLVLSENEDFYAVKPPSEFKAYVFRTFVLDDVIEGNHVNVRLKPDLEAPVIAQFNSGDRVEGVIDPSSPKWLEIDMPQSARFYIAKEYIEKVGDANYLAQKEKRAHDVELLLSTNESLAEKEMQKPFEHINIENIKASYQQIISDYADFPEAVFKAKNDLATLQEKYTNKKVAYLESQTHLAKSKINDANQLSRELQAHKVKIANLEQQLEQNRFIPVNPNHPVEELSFSKPQVLPINMTIWMPQEDALFSAWSHQTGNSDINYFYQEQNQQSIQLRGLIEPYNRPVKNKPGDYMLVNPISQLPMAYLYSSQVNLQDYVGHEITVRVSPRPNNHFAYPAYYVLFVE